MAVPESQGVSDRERNWGIVTHLLVFPGPVALPWNILIPLIIFLVNKGRDKSEFIEFNAREALNFQISMEIYFFLLSVLVGATLGLLTLISFLISVSVLFALVSLILTVKAALEAKNRNRFEYPFTIRLI